MKLFTLILCIALNAGALHAGAEAGQPGGYLRVGVGARAAALGNAYTALAEGPEAIYWNPAGLAFTQRPALNTMVSLLSLNRQFSYAGLNLAFDAPQARQGRAEALSPTAGLGPWGLGWLTFSLGDDFEGRTGDTSSFYVFGDRQNAYLFSHGRALAPWFAAGGTFKVFERRLDKYEALGFGGDAGLLLILGPQVRFGLQVQDFASNLRWSTGYQEQLPLALKANLAGWAWKDRLMLSAQAEAVQGRQASFGVGLETKIAQVLSGRLGWQKDGLTLGGGLEFALTKFQGRLDYAYLPDALQQGQTQRFSVEISF